MADAAALVRRLRSPRRLEQRQAAQDIRCLAEEGTDEQRERLAAAGCIPLLVGLLRSGSPALQEPAAKALGSLAADSPERCAASIAAGGHTSLLQLCASDDERVFTAACDAFHDFARDRASRTALLQAEPFPALVSVMQRSGSSSSSSHSSSSSNSSSRSSELTPTLVAVELAVHAVIQLCTLDPSSGQASQDSSRAARSAATAAGAPAALVPLLRRPEEPLQVAAALALNDLASGHAIHASDAIVASGGLAALAERLCAADCDTPLAAAVTCALMFVAGTRPEHAAALAAMPGVVPRLVQLLGGSASGGSSSASISMSGEVQARAAVIVNSMAYAGEQVVAAVVAAGVAPALAAALHGPKAHIKLHRCAAECARTLAEKGQAPALRAAGVDQALQQLVASGGQPADRLTAAAALGCMINSPPAIDQPARPPRVCANPGCGAKRGLKRCGGCGTVRYCSEACSRAHWRSHRAECRRLQAEQASTATAGGGSQG